MTFRNSKYQNNSWKTPNFIKNFHVAYKFRGWLHPLYIILAGFLYIHFNGSHLIHRKLLNDLIPVKNIFEKKKTEQVSFDYMIYAKSKREENNIDSLSII